MKNWTYRLSQSNREQRAIKTELLPLPKPIRDVLSLEYHLQLEALRAGAGSLMALQILMRVAMAAGMLSELGYGKPGLDSLDDYEHVANEAFFAGQDGRFGLDNKAFRLFAGLLTNHDAQLEVAPVRVIDGIAKYLEQHGGAA
ncbi:Fis family transcriptional regulator [Trinickia acidisoli]|uniref:Fis family transcriptional regulator n=1 Tax=Trinickia acidisoli TaxID=2767482 RepID=UPI001A8E5D35|nr:Fis family transcriptional regulator [Trinickia acidisoli]